MTVELINKLLIKYFNGDTNLEEEKILRGYFLNEKIDEKLVKYAPFFIFLNNEKNVEISDDFSNKIGEISIKNKPVLTVVKNNFYWLKIAASVAFLLLGTWIISKQFDVKNNAQIAVNQPVKRKAKVIILDETTDPNLAFAEVEKALLLVSKNIKKGTEGTTESLQKIKSATKVLNQ